MPTALITGASSGFGAALARLLSKNGYRLILTARRADRLQEVARECRTATHIAAFDIRIRREVEAFHAGLPDEWRDIDVLVNNAGLAQGLSSADEGNLDDWETMVHTNILGLLYMTRLFLPRMKERNSGHIVNLGSVASKAAYKGGNVYGATKAFVGHFSRNLRADLLGTRIRVTNIEPGMAETEFSLGRFHGDAERAKQVYADTEPLTADDVAEAIHWAISRPAHVNIDNIEIMPTMQSWAGLTVVREEKVG